ncbi:MAG: PKD domain-containing protein [Planctomycetaceae bacterium]
MLISTFLKSFERLFSIVQNGRQARFLRTRSIVQGRRYRRTDELEPRQLLSAVQWDGGAGTSNWDDAANWDSDAVPTDSDDVTVTGADVAVHSALNLRSLTLSDARLSVLATQFIAVDQLTVSTGGQINAGSGELTIHPQTAGRLINVGGSDSGTELGVSSEELSRLVCSTLTLGAFSSGTVSFTAPISSSSHLRVLTGNGASLQSSIVMAEDRNLTIESSGTSVGVTLIDEQADITTSGTGSIQLTSARNVVQNPGSQLVTANGGVTLSGNLDGLGTGAFSGVEVLGSVITNGSGPVLLQGRGGSLAGADIQRGVVVGLAGSTVKSTAAVNGGSITIIGFGGNGNNLNIGVDVTAEGVVESVNGAISITGTGAGTGHTNLGVSIFTAAVRSLGTGPAAAPVTITGTGAGFGTQADGTSDNDGVRVSGTGSLVSSIDGSISINGQGGEGTLWGNRGIGVFQGTIAATGSGMITLTGTGGKGSSDQNGIQTSNSQIATATGRINLTGHGGTGSDAVNRGIGLFDGTQVISSGGGDIHVEAIAGAGTHSNRGLEMSNGANLLRSAGGNIDVTGVGGASTNPGVSSSFGIWLWGGAGIETTGGGTIHLTGTGGSGTGNDIGVVVDNNTFAPSTGPSHVTAEDGDIVVIATSGASTGDNNSGLVLYAGGRIETTGLGNVNLQGTAQGTGGYGCDGIILNNDNAPAGFVTSITTTAGRITAIGKGSGHSQMAYNEGILLNNGVVVATVSGPITLNGTGGGGRFDNRGIIIQGTGTTVSSVSGDILVEGQGGTGVNTDGYGGHRGVVMAIGARIESSGPANITINGTGGGTGTFGGGVLIIDANTSVRSTASGNILIHGTGGAASGDVAIGATLVNSATITSLGTGAITFVGVGGAGAAGSIGAEVWGGNAEIRSVSGPILINGTGGGTSAGTFNRGVNISNTGKVTASGSATITLIGTSGAGSNSHAVGISDGTVSVTGTGSLSAFGDSIVFDGTTTLSAGAANVTLGPRSSGRIVDIGTDDTTTSLGLTDAELDRITTTGVLQIGTLPSGSLRITAPISASTYSTLKLESSGGVTQSGSGNITVTSLALSGGNVTLGTTASNVTTLASSSASLDFREASDLTIGSVAGINGVTATAGNAQVRVNTGNLTVSNTASQDDIAASGSIVLTASAADAVLQISTGADIESVNGDITLTSDRIMVNGTLTAAGHEAILQQSTSGRTIQIGSTTDSAFAALEIADAELDRITAGTIRMGNAQSGPVVISNSIQAGAGTSNVVITTGQNISIGLVSLTTISGNVTLSANADGLAVSNFTGISNNGTIQSLGSGSVTLLARAGGTGASNFGIDVPGRVLSAGGLISLTGYGALYSGGANTYGINIRGAGQVATTNAAGITLRGFGGLGTFGNEGVIVWAGGQVTAVNGSISVYGTGGGNATGNSSSNNGITLYNNGVIETTGNGSVLLDGTGGTGSSSFSGVALTTANSRVTSVNGAVTVIGRGSSTGQSTGSGFHGVSVGPDSRIESLGTGVITVTGTGGTQGSFNVGVIVNGVNSRIVATNGSLTINGTGGRGTGGSMIGISVQGSGTVSSTGAASISMTGQGGNAAGGANFGIEINNSAVVSTQAGSATMLGTAGVGGNNNFGLRISNTSTISTDSGTVQIQGIATDTNGGSQHGFFMDTAGSIVTTGTGPIYLSGIAANSVGLLMNTGANVRSTSTAANAGTINLNGVSEGGTWALGIDGIGTDTYVRSVRGDITITASHSAVTTPIGSFVDGVVLWRRGIVESTGTAKITINGTAGRGISANRGVVISGTGSFVRSTLGDILIQGQGGIGNTTGVSGANLSNFGVRVEGGAIVQSLGSAKLTIEGTGGSGNNNNTGVSISDSGSLVSVVNSQLSITGNGGVGAINAGSSPNNSYGIEVVNSGRLSIASGQAEIVGRGGSGSGTAVGNNHGIVVSTSGIMESTGSGTLQLRGTGGTGSSSNFGVSVESSGLIRSTAVGTGQVQIDGTGGTGSGGFHHGISVTATSVISLGAAHLLLNGTGGTSSSAGQGDSRGVSITSSGIVQVTSGDLTINGTGGVGAANLDGIYLSDAASRINGTGSSGKIFVNGSGGTGTGASNRGIVIRNGAKISGKNDVVLNGTGGTGSGNATGVLLTDSATEVFSQPIIFDPEHQFVSIVGAGGTGGGSNHGVWITNSAAINSNLGTNITGIEGSGSSSLGISLFGHGTVSGGYNGATLAADSISLDTSGAANLISGITRIAQRTVGTRIDLGGSDRTEVSGRVLGLTDAELDRIQTYFEIGNSSKGAVTVSAPISISYPVDAMRIYGLRELTETGSLSAFELYVDPIPMSPITSTSNAPIELQGRSALVFGAGESTGTGLGTAAHPLRIDTGELVVKLASNVGAVAYLQQSSHTRMNQINIPGGTIFLSGGTFTQDNDDEISPTTNLVLADGATWILNSHSVGGGEGEEPTYLQTVQHLQSLTVLNGNVLSDSMWNGTEYVTGGIILCETDVEFAQGQLSAELSGSHGLIKTGDGQVSVSSRQSYAGDTVIEEGILSLVHSESWNPIEFSGVIDVRGGAIFDTTQLEHYDPLLESWGYGFRLNSDQTLIGTGDVWGQVEVEGTLAPGPYHGRLTIVDSMNLVAGGRFIAQIAGVSVDENLTQVRTATSPTLEGTLELQLSSEFDPVAGDQFLILLNDSDLPVDGEFNGLPEGTVFTVGTESFRITYLGGDGNDVVLETVLAVINTDDDGFGSLRRAMTEANTLPGDNTIIFSIPGTGTHIISPLTPLPVLNGPTRILATTQPGYFGSPLIELRGHEGLPEGTDGIHLESDGNSEVAGLSITGFSGTGLRIVAWNGLVAVNSNYIGAGTGSFLMPGNQHYGLVLSGDAVIGVGYSLDQIDDFQDLVPAPGNIISGNSNGGVLLDNALEVWMNGNIVGLHPNGQFSLPNYGHGITVRNGSGGELTGGNVVSGNTGDGILMESSAAYLSVEEAVIGLNEDGARPVSNGGFGIRVQRDDTSPAYGGVYLFQSTISGNAGGGFFYDDYRSTPLSPQSLSIESSRFGVTYGGNRAAANGEVGIRIQQRFVDSDLNNNSDSFELLSNIISGNSGDGLLLKDVPKIYVAMNRIGTDASGSSAIPNEIGIRLVHESSVPSTAEFIGNTVSGNRDIGIWMTDSSNPDVMSESILLATAFSDNMVGSDSAGTQALANGRGVLLEFSAGSESSAVHYVTWTGGVISGNNGAGVTISGDDENAIVDLDTAIGVDLNRDFPLANRGNGVLVSSDVIHVNLLGHSIIAANRGNGVRHEGSGTGSNIAFGRIADQLDGAPLLYGNLGLAIDLGSPGPTGNSDIETDYPVVVAANLTDDAGSENSFLDIVGTNPILGGYFVQFYSTRPTVTGRGQGSAAIGSFAQLSGFELPDEITSQLDGVYREADLDPRPDHFRFRLTVPDNFGARLLTATMIDPLSGGSTFHFAGISEFSPIVPVGTQLTHLPPVVNAGGDTKVVSGEALQRAVTFRDDDSVEFEVVVDYGDGEGFGYATYRPQDRVILLDHTYRSVGQYVVSVSVLDDTTPIGLIDIDSFIVTVENALPEVRFNEVEISKRVSEGETVNLTGTFEDADIEDLHTVEVDWGDGTVDPPQALPTGQRTFSLNHVYPDDGQSGASSHLYRVVVTVRDAAGATSATPVFLVQVDNVLPKWNSVTPALEVSSSEITEGDSVTLNGAFTDPGLLDSHTVVVNWGDGSPLEKVASAAILQSGQHRRFSLSHRYRDNPVNGSRYLIQVDLADDDEPAIKTSASVSVDVVNQVPVIQPLLIADGTLEEGDAQAVFISFADSGIENHTAIVNWGDGSAETAYQILPGRFSISVNHHYRRDGEYVIQARVVDRDGAESATESTVFHVTNFLPTLGPVSISSGGNAEGQVQEAERFELSGSYDDLSPSDRQSIIVNWGDGTPATPVMIDRVHRTWHASHVYSDDGSGGSGTRVYSATVSISDETDVTSRVVPVTVLNVRPIVSVIPVLTAATDKVRLRALGSDQSPEDGLHLSFTWTVTQNGAPVSFTQISPDEIELDASSSPMTVLEGGGGLLLVTAQVSDDDGGVSDPWKAGVIFGTSGNDLIRISDGSFTDGVTRIIAAGLAGNDVLDASTITNAGFSVLLTGGTGNDLLFDGPGNDTIILAQGDDSLNIPLSDPRNQFFDEFGQPFQITPNTNGDDEIYLIVNSVQEAWDNIGNNGLNFSLNESAVSQQYGIHFDLSVTQQLSPEQTLEHQDVAPTSAEPSQHFAGALGRFVRLTGSNYGDTLTGASNSQVFGGRGSDQFLAKDGMNAVRFVGGADDDALVNSAGSLADIFFGGDDGSDRLENLGSIIDLVFNGGADDDVLQNLAGATILGLSFGGDDGSDSLLNNGSLADLVFTGGADGDILQNLAGADITGLSFGGDDGSDSLLNNGSLADLVFTGGADDDILQNMAGAEIIGLSFGGDDGSDSLLNNGSLADLVFTGGADDDILQNLAGAGITGLSFGGDDGSDALLNSGTLADLVFTGGADDDLLQNMAGAEIIGLSFGGDDGSDALLNSGTLADLVFTGGADDDLLQNMAGAEIIGLSFGGDDGSDALLNSGTLADLVFTGGADDDLLQNMAGAEIIGLSFGGDDGSDALLNSGTLADLVFTGGADDDILQNMAGAEIIGLSFGGDDGSDALLNSGTLADLVFTGGADDDLLQNMAGAEIIGLSFGGDDGSDSLLNSGTLADLVFTGGADDDILQNMAGAEIIGLSFGGDDGSDALLNSGTLADLVFTGGADDDILQNMAGASIIGLSFGGDDGSDLLINLGAITDLTFQGGADDDVLQNYASAQLTGEIYFGGDDGTDVLVNLASGLFDLTFSGGADDDILINLGSRVANLHFDGGEGNNAFVNWGSQQDSSVVHVLTMTGGSGSNAMRNEGSGWTELRYSGGSGNDFLQNNAKRIGLLHFEGGGGQDALENNASGVSQIQLIGSDGSDTFANDGNNVSGIYFAAGDGNNRFINSGNAVSDVTYVGGMGNDRILDYGTFLSDSSFTGGAGNDVFILRGAHASNLSFSGEEGSDTLRIETTAGNSSFLSFDGGYDDSSDVLLNLASEIYGLSFSGGAGDDAFQNQGRSVDSIFMSGGIGNDTFLNRGSSVGNVRFFGGEGNDTLENRGHNGGVFEMMGDAGNDVFFQSGGRAFSAFLRGGDGNDVLQNYANSVYALELVGDEGSDSLINSGNLVTSILLTGGAGHNLLRNYGSQINRIASTGSNISANTADVIQNSGSWIHEIVLSANVPLTLTSSGNAIESIHVDGSEFSDTVQISGRQIGNIVVDGRAGDDSVSVSLDVPSPFLSFDGAAGQDILFVRGTISTVLFDGGDGDDTVIFASTVDTAELNGADGDDVYQFLGSPTGQVRISEQYSGSIDESRDTLDFSAFQPGAVTLDLQLLSAQQQPAGTGSLWIELSDTMGIENVIGTQFADTLLGNARPNLLTGAQFLANGQSESSTPVTWNREQWVFLDFTSCFDEGEFVYSDADIAAIKERLEQIYIGLPVHFVTNTEAIPAAVRVSGQFATICFNDTPSTGRPGGEASEIDPGNQNYGGTASVQISGMLGGRETYGTDMLLELASSGLSDGDEIQAPDLPKPASTSTNLRALSAKIAAHELGHLLGMRHYDAFGPIGFGITGPPGPAEFTPFYTGISAAFETADHIISSPAAVGTTRFNDLRELYFGEREAIKLALAFSSFSDIHSTEESGPHRTQSSAFPIALNSISVPTLTNIGSTRDKSQRVDALLLTGSIETFEGYSESDWYSFTVGAGDIFSFEVMSRSLAKYNASADTSIDSLIRIYDHTGQLVRTLSGHALNDDDFESSDSVLLDVSFEASGTYYIEIDTFHRSVDDPDYEHAVLIRDQLRSRRDDSDPSNDLSDQEVDFLARLEDSLADTDTGSYELLMYRSHRVNSTDQIDSLQGRSGLDTLYGGPGDDYSISLDVQWNGLTVPEAAQWSNSLSFHDRGGYSWTLIVDYGDGTSAIRSDIEPGEPTPFDHIYGDDGVYVVTITVMNDDGLVAVSTATVVVTNVAPSANLNGSSTGVAGAPMLWTANASDPAGAFDPLSYQWIITRGSSVITTQTGGLALEFTPLQTGTYKVTIIVNDGDGGVTTVFRDFTVIAPAAVTSTMIDNGGIQRSMVRSLTVSFDQSVVILPGAFSVLKRGGGSVPLQSPQIAIVSGKTVVTLRFAAGQHVAPGNSLEDGNYELRIDASKVLFGNAPLDGNGDGLSGGTYILGNQAGHQFFRLFGDANGDRVVNTTDASLFNLTYRKTSSQNGFNFAFDYDGDGDVDSLDYLYMRGQINKTMSWF